MIKVALICHYWSKETEEILGLKHYFRELSPWIQEYINLYKKKNDVELHVVAPNYTSNTNFECQKDGIYFHFFHYSPSFLSTIIAPIVRCKLNHDEPYKIAERAANVLTNFKTTFNEIPKIVDRIVPDVVHVYGTENPDYSAGVIPLLDRYPILITIQGYAYLAEDRPLRLDQKFQNIRRRIEKELNTSANYLVVSPNLPDMPEFKPFENGQKRFLSGGNITRRPKIMASHINKKYDISFYGRVTSDKGVEDLVKAISLLCSKGLKLKTLIIGKCTDSYKSYLCSIADEYQASNLLTFSGFVEDHDDVYALAASAIMAVLPTRIDLMPNTIREAIGMGLPVVASNAGYIPLLNNKRETVKIHKVGDIEDLASKIEEVYQDESLRKKLIKNGMTTFDERFSMNNVYSRSVEIYKEVQKDFLMHHKD